MVPGRGRQLPGKVGELVVMLHAAGGMRVVLRCAGALLISCLLWVAVALPTAEQVARARSRPAPSDRALIVIANLQEAFGSSDVRNPRDMRVFARRVLRRTPYRPDVLLLQEVRRRSARFVARRLSRRTRHRYVVAVDPGRDPWKQTPRKVVKKETAILINGHTMRKLRPGGFISTSYDPRYGKREVKENAHLLAGKRGSNLSLSLASIHWPGRTGSQRRTNRLGVRWSRKVADALVRKHPAATKRLRSIGGDFNRPCYHRPTYRHKWRPYPYCATLTNDRYRYKNAVFVVDARPNNKDIVNGGVDHIFARGQILSAGVDDAYNRLKAASSPRRYYSDHKFRWAVVAAP
jgi:Endonuclease/Exonuclease/phosphatase family